MVKWQWQWISLILYRTSDVQNANKNLNDFKMTFQFNSREKIKYKRNAKQRKLSTIKALRAVVLWVYCIFHCSCSFLCNSGKGAGKGRLEKVTENSLKVTKRSWNFNFCLELTLISFYIKACFYSSIWYPSYRPPAIEHTVHTSDLYFWWNCAPFFFESYKYFLSCLWPMFRGVTHWNWD